MSNAIEVTDETFRKEVIDSSVPVLVDFWAPWCGPCKAMGPAVDQLADEMSDQLKVVKCDTQDNPNTPASFGVMGIPCFIIFKGGEEVARSAGMMNYEQFKAFVEPHV